LSRFLLRVVAAAGARGNSPACSGLRQPARFIPSAPSMLGAAQKDCDPKPSNNPMLVYQMDT
jgi:hypothetical protein